MEINNLVSVFTLGDCADRTGCLTWHGDFDDGVVGAVLLTDSAVDAFFGVDVRVVDYMDGFFGAVHHAGAGKTSLAGVRHHEILFYASVACLVQDRNHGPRGFFAGQCLLRVIVKLVQVVVVFHGDSHAGQNPHAQKLPVMVGAASDRRCAGWSHFHGNLVYFP